MSKAISVRQISKSYGDFVAVISPAPDRHGRALLKHHVIGEEIMQPDFGAGGEGAARGEQHAEKCSWSHGQSEDDSQLPVKQGEMRTGRLGASEHCSSNDEAGRWSAAILAARRARRPRSSHRRDEFKNSVRMRPCDWKWRSRLAP